MSDGKIIGTTSPTDLGGDIGRTVEVRGRATPKGPGFGSVLAASRPLMKGAEAVASLLPGGPLVAAAVRSVSTKSGPTMGSGGAGGVSISPRGADGLTGVGAKGGSPAGAEGSGVEGVLADSQAFNLYFLQLQEQISAENRQYSTLSNVLKARHDTVKNAIGNIR